MHLGRQRPRHGARGRRRRPERRARGAARPASRQWRACPRATVGGPSPSILSAGTVRAPPKSSASMARKSGRVEPRRSAPSPGSRSVANSEPAAQRPARVGAVADREDIGHAVTSRPASSTRRRRRVKARQDSVRPRRYRCHSPAGKPALVRRLRKGRGGFPGFGRRNPPGSGELRGDPMVDPRRSSIEDGADRAVLPCPWRGGREMAFEDSGTRTVTRRAMGAEMLDAETELALARAWRDDARREGAAPAGQRLHAAGDLDGRRATAATARRCPT